MSHDTHSVCRCCSCHKINGYWTTCRYPCGSLVVIVGTTKRQPSYAENVRTGRRKLSLERTTSQTTTGICKHTVVMCNWPLLQCFPGGTGTGGYHHRQAHLLCVFANLGRLQAKARESSISDARTEHSSQTTSQTNAQQCCLTLESHVCT